MRAVARAEPTTVLALTVQRHATQMSANAQKNQILGVLGTRRVSLGVTQFYAQLLVDAHEMDTQQYLPPKLTSLAVSISSAVRWRMKRGLPRHLTMTVWPSARVLKSTYTCETLVACSIATSHRARAWLRSHSGETYLDVSHGQNISRGTHSRQELADEVLCGGGETNT